MTDKEYWKKLYKGEWAAGNRRAQKISELLQSWGYKVGDYGFLANSTKYSKDSPKEKGIPDHQIEKDGKKLCLLEVTGTKIKRGSGIWIRPDKFEYAANHPEEDCWLGYIEESSGTIKFLKLDNKDQYETIQPTIREVTETFKVIPDDSEKLIEPEKFREYLDSK